jgi:hypothetical protein
MRKMKLEPLLDNHAIIDVLQRMFFSESKPSQLIPVDLAVITYLVLRRCVDHAIFDSQDTIAQRVCVERKTVMDSLARLELAGWISLGGRGKGRSKAISINFEAFPAMQPVRDKISDGARALVREYVLELQKAGRRKFPKQWATRQLPSAQRILTKCGGDVNLAYRMMRFAFVHPELRNRARMSVYHMVCIWPKVTKTYHAYMEQMALTQNNMEGTNDPTKIQSLAAA